MFRGKLPFKCFACGRVGHYSTKCPYKENLNKGKNSSKGNVKIRFENKKICYTHEDSGYSSNNKDDESDMIVNFLWNWKENV